MHPAVNRINEILPLLNQDVQRHAQIVHVLQTHKDNTMRALNSLTTTFQSQHSVQ